jgi:glycine cleavage system H protein
VRRKKTMKELDELNLPEDVKYAEDHEWVKSEGSATKIGISDYAQDQLGDIVFVELPEVGSSFQKGDEFGTVESVKAVSVLFMPVSGEVTAVNKALEDDPDLVNTQPYTGGWMLEVKMKDAGEGDALMSKSDYLAFLKSLT